MRAILTQKIVYKILQEPKMKLKIDLKTKETNCFIEKTQQIK